jgi:hypothetical protein
VVLLRIEHFQHGGRGVALDAAAHLVDLVEHHDAVARLGFADRLDDVAGQRPDVGAPVPPDFGLVVHAAEAHPHEGPVHGAGDRLAERGLADAGRTDEAQDRGLAAGRELAHGEVLDDAPLDFFEPVVVLVEDAPGLGDVDRLRLRQPPGQLDQPVEVGADHAGLGGRLRRPLVTAQLFSRLLLHLRRHGGLADRLGEFGHLLGLAVALAQLALDGGHLLAQHGLALALVERRFGLLADLVGQAQDLDASGEQARDLVDPRHQIDRL